MKITLIQDTAKLQAAIKSIATRGKALDKDIHIAAVSCLNHADKHGDVTLAQRLVDALPNTARKNALRDWFLAMGKFKYDTENKMFKFDKTKTTMLEDACNMPFWEFQPEKAYVPFDISAAIKALLARAEKAAKRGDNVPAEKLEALRNLTGEEVTEKVDF